MVMADYLITLWFLCGWHKKLHGTCMEKKAIVLPYVAPATSQMYWHKKLLGTCKEKKPL